MARVFLLMTLSLYIPRNPFPSSLSIYPAKTSPNITSYNFIIFSPLRGGEVIETVTTLKYKGFLVGGRIIGKRPETFFNYVE